jgi:hypothetical protein
MGFQPMQSDFHHRVALPTRSTQPEAQRSFSFVRTLPDNCGNLDAAGGEIGFLGWNVIRNKKTACMRWKPM